MASACLAGVCETPASMLRAAGISLYPKTLGADSGIAEHAQTLGTDTGQRTLEADSGIAEHARTLGADTGGAVVGRGAIYGPADTAPLISGSVGLSQTLGFSDYGGALGEPQTFQETSDTRTSTPPRVSGFSRTHPPTPLGFGRRDGRGNGAMTPLAQAEGVALLPAGILRLRAKLRHASTQGLGSGGGAGGFVSGIFFDFLIFFLIFDSPILCVQITIFRGFDYLLFTAQLDCRSQDSVLCQQGINKRDFLFQITVNCNSFFNQYVQFSIFLATETWLQQWL
ncbi:hypothetical protein T492DRAFT_350838 [Pavlovales sp. CCMP2436]|nr:hypothetical protein T492DRAFT_350838 [Pavlovales sp. CCMP2436]